MEKAKILLKRASESGKVRKPFLQLGVVKEGGGVESTGKHIIRIVKEVGLVKVNNPRTGAPEDRLQLLVNEGGVEKIWNVPVKDKEGNLHYLIQRLAEIEEGDEVEVEMKKKKVGVGNYISLHKVGDIKNNEDNREDSGEIMFGGEEGASEPDFFDEEGAL